MTQSTGTVVITVSSGVAQVVYADHASAAYASAADGASAEEAEWRWQEKLLADIIHGRHNV